MEQIGDVTEVSKIKTKLLAAGLWRSYLSSQWGAPTWPCILGLLLVSACIWNIALQVSPDNPPILFAFQLLLGLLILLITPILWRHRLLVMRIIIALSFLIPFAVLESLDPPPAYAAAPDGDWWDSSYAYRQKITVTTGTAAILNGYSLSATLDHAALVIASKSLANGDDIRIVYWNGSTWTELDRALQEGSAWNNASTILWFKGQAAISASSSDDNYYLYYGNAAATNPPANKKNIYTFWDDFDDGSLEAGWSLNAIGPVSGGTTNESGSAVTISATSTGDLQGSSDTVYHLSRSFSGSFLTESFTIGPSGTHGGSSKYGGVHLRISNMTNSRNRTMAEVYSSAGSSNSYRVKSGQSTSEQLGQRYDFNRVTRIGSNSRAFNSNDGLMWNEVGTEISFSGAVPATLTIGPVLAGISSSPHSVDVDWFKIRLYVEPEPSTILTSEESTPPQSPYAEGQLTPVTRITDLTPEFSAIFDDPDTSDTAAFYQFEVNTQSDFLGTSMWDSTKTALSPPLAENARMPDVSYAGTALSLNGAQYYWRIKFCDSDGTEGTWSSTQTFYMAEESSTYRSIGTNAATLYAVGTASISQGASTVTFAGGASLPGNVGQGDKLTIGGEVFYIKSRDSATQATVQEKAGADHSGEAYTIARAYNTISFWEADRQGDLVAENRIEVGVAYNDGEFDEGSITIDGSTTDAAHYLWLTAADGQRHNGTAGTGVRLDPLALSRYHISVNDAYTVIEWIEISGWGDPGGAGAAIDTRSGGEGTTLGYLLIHDNNNTSAGIIAENAAAVRLFNSVLYNLNDGATKNSPSAAGSRYLEIYNVTAYNCGGYGFWNNSLATDQVVKNSIAVGHSLADFFGIAALNADYNLSSDTTAPGVNSLTLRTAANQFASIVAGSEDLHLKDGADALDAGVEVSAILTDDIDGDARPLNSGWEMGADEHYFTQPPSPPQSPFAEGQLTPVTHVTDLTPEFSAIYDDPDTSDTAAFFQIEVNTQSDFLGTSMWDSTKTALSPPLAENARMPDISYAGTALNLNGVQYFWRIKFWDNTGVEGAWSATQTFYMAGESSTYRSIGTNAATLYDVGDASISQGSNTVTFAGGASLPGNVGQGDKLTIGSEIFYIKTRDSDTQATVQEKAGASHSGEAYTIVRAYNTISAWEADRQGDLVAENRIEVGVTYNDSPFDEQVVVSGSTTDASHYMHLTVASGQRHDGTAGTGTRFHPASVAYGTSPFQIQDHYFIIEWVDFDETDTGGHSETLTLTGTDITARYLILRGARDNNTGINVSSSNSKIYNNFIYKISNLLAPNYGALWLNSLNGGIEAYNNTVFNNTGTGITFGSGGTDHIVKNNISVTNSGGDFSDSGAYTAANNLSSDNTARGIDSLKDKPGANQLISVTDGSEDLHLKDGADALDAGIDASSILNDDIDGDSRPKNAGWDIGADERHYSSVTDQDITFTNITLNGLVQTLTGSTNPWQVESTSPAGTTWSVAISANDFSDGSHTICMNSLEVRLLDANIIILTGSDKPSSQMTNFTPLSGSGQTLLAYSGLDGAGIFQFTPEFQLHLPAETYTGSYSATVTVTYVLGP